MYDYIYSSWQIKYIYIWICHLEHDDHDSPTSTLHKLCDVIVCRKLQQACGAGIMSTWHDSASRSARWGVTQDFQDIPTPWKFACISPNR